MTTVVSPASLKRIQETVAADQDASRGGDLLKLLRPVTQGQSRKQQMTSEAYSVYPESERSIKALAKTQPIPEGVAMAIGEAECASNMGLFPEIDRAWIIVDNILFLWDYNQLGNAYESYSEPNGQLIVSVALCRPKQGFESLTPSSPTSPEYLIVVATLLNVTVLRIDRRGTAGLSLTDVKVNASTDGVLMRHIQGTIDGRIFMAGEDGSVHEFFYETKRNFLHNLGLKRQCFTLDRSKSGITSAMSWIVPPAVQHMYTSLISASDPLVRLEIDDGRKLMYTLSKKGIISLLNWSRPDSLTFIATFDCANLERTLDMRMISASMVGVKDVDLKNFEISSIDAVVNPTSSIHLVVTARSGVRIFFTTCESVSAAATSGQGNSRASGRKLNPVSIRGPPEAGKLRELRSGRQSEKVLHIPAALNSGGSQPLVVKAYSHGGDVSFMCFDSVLRQDSKDIPSLDVMCVSLDLSSSSMATWELEFHREELGDRVFGTNIEGRVHHVRELAASDSSSKMRKHWLGVADQLDGEAAAVSEMVTQFGPFGRRKFLVLASTGTRLLEKNRPIDLLVSLLEGPRASAERLVPLFFRRFGLNESCAMALALATSDPFPIGGSNIFSQDWTQIKVASKASMFLSLLGFAIPSDESTGEKEFKLPSLKSLRLQERQKLAVSIAMVPNWANGRVDTSERKAAAITGEASGQRAVLAVGSGPVARDVSNKSIDEVEIDVLYSGCFEGLVLLIARLLRPIWQWMIIADGAFRWSVNELNAIKKPLESLSQFMERHHPFAQAVANKGKIKVSQFTPAIIEEIRIGEMHSLLKRVSSAINFFCEIQASGRTYASHFKAAIVESKDSGELEKMTWEKFVTQDSGTKLARMLVRALLDREPSLRDANYLRQFSERCGDFFSRTYFTHVLAMDELGMAEREQRNKEWQINHVDKALSLLGETFKQSIASDAQKEEALDRLAEACLRCVRLKEHWRAVQLCLNLAINACDASSVDSYQVPSSSSMMYEEATTLTKFRMQCYERALSVMETCEADDLYNRCLETIFLSNDAMFQFFVFSKLLESNQLQILVDATPASLVESFMKNTSFNTYMGSKHRDIHLLLYSKWLARHERLGEAASVLKQLADIDDADWSRNPTVFDRLDYLNEAIVYDGERSENLKKRLHLVRSAIEIRQALLNANVDGGERNPLVMELTRQPVKELRLFDICEMEGLWEEYLALLQFFASDRDNAERVNDVYGELLAPLIEKWDAPRIIETMERLARRFGTSSRVFPLNELVDNLEIAALARVKKMRGKSDMAETWLLDALLRGGIPFVRLFVAYARLACSFEQPMDDTALVALRLFTIVLREWSRIQPAEVAAYKDRAISSDVDLGSISTVIRRLQRLFEGEDEALDELDGVFEELQEI